MANHKSAIKRIGQNRKRAERNRQHRSAMRTAMKKVRTAAEAGEKTVAADALQAAMKKLDKMATKGIIHPRNAARRISRLAKLVNKVA